MSYFHQMKTVEDQQRMLKKILSMQTQIRARREKDRLTSNSQNEKYTKIFEPITQSLKNLADIPSTTLHVNNVTHADDLINFEDPNNLIDDQDDLINFKDPNNLIDFQDDHILPTPLQPTPNGIELKHDTDDDSFFNDVNPDDDSFLNTVRSIPDKDRDDGVFGLNINRKCIGNNTFIVKGNVLIVRNNEDHSESIFVVNDVNVWKLLLAQRPGSLMELKTIKGHYIPAVKEYVDIVKTLNLINLAQRTHLRTFKNRSKYKLIDDFSKKYKPFSKKGSGFLFSVSPPPFLRKQKVKKTTTTTTIKPSTVVIPSDKKGLMRALLQALAELRAGNTSMRNFVVPLAKEAKRKKILPPNLLSADEETWVFA